MPAGPHQVKFKPEIVDAILDLIGKHIPYKKACLSNGVSEKTFYLWLERAEKEIAEGIESEYVDLLKRLNTIESKRIQHHLNNLQDNENGHKGAQWVLERVFWKYYSPKIGEIELNERVEKLESGAGNADKKEESKDE